MKKNLKKSSPKTDKKTFDLVTGTLRTHSRGFGFVQPDSPCDFDEIFIPKTAIEHAVDGDRVEVAINPHSNWAKGADGKVVAVLSRGRTHLGGTIWKQGNNQEFLAYVPLLGSEKPAVVTTTTPTTLAIGDRVILKVNSWGNEQQPTICELTHVIGNISDASKDIAAAVEEFDLNDSFPSTAFKEALKWGEKVPDSERLKRLDLTKLPTITIDPTTAKDFDDALSLSKDKKGHFHLAVHIADVAHYVKKGSALDTEAKERSNSTYFPGFCLPMLPPQLSESLCSLRPKVLRLTVSVIMEFSQTGDLLHYSIERSCIKSRKRFTYEEAKEVLDGKSKSPYKKMLALMVELCHLLKQKRYHRGGIDFALPDFVLQIDEKGEPFAVQRIEYDITHQLVEEFMLKANEVVAKHLSDSGKNLIFRVHEEPLDENFQDFIKVARSLGLTVGQKPSKKDLQHLFKQAAATPFAQQLFVAFIRSMKLAFYSSENVGHYGLSLEHYTHFTSPIRRYSDLIIERLLFEEEPPLNELEKSAQRCSEQERISFRAEMHVKNLKKLRLLERYLKEDPSRTFQAVITKIKPFGIYFEVDPMMLEGFLRISELEDDYFQYNAQANLLKGERTGISHQVGKTIEVIPTQIDLIQQETRWQLCSPLPRKPRPSQKRRKRR